MNEFDSLWNVFWNDTRRFGFSTRSLGHVMFSFLGNAQEAGAGGRSGASGIPVVGSLLGRFLGISREVKHHVTKTSS